MRYFGIYHKELYNVDILCENTTSTMPVSRGEGSVFSCLLIDDRSLFGLYYNKNYLLTFYGIGAIKRNVKNGCFAWVTFLKKVYDIQ
jgi:hypothetical protein